MFLTVFPLFMPKSKSLWSLFSQLLFSQSLFSQSLYFKEQHEQFDHIELYKRVTVSDSLWSLITKERP